MILIKLERNKPCPGRRFRVAQSEVLLGAACITQLGR